MCRRSQLEIGRHQLADLVVRNGQPKPASGIYLVNRRGDLRLEQLRISRWNGEAPADVPQDKSGIYRLDGATTTGQIERCAASDTSN